MSINESLMNHILLVLIVCFLSEYGKMYLVSIFATITESINTYQ